MESNISEETIANYTRKLNYLTVLNIDYKTINNVNELFDKIKMIRLRKKNKHLTKGVTCIHLSSALLYLKAIKYYYFSLNKKTENIKKTIDILTRKINAVRKIVDNPVVNCTFLGNQKENYVSWKRVSEIYEEVKLYRCANKKLFLEYVVLSLYYLLPVRRLEDYSLMKISIDGKNLDPSFNYYVNIDKGYFIFQKYKTFKIFGIQNILLPKKLNDILKEYIYKYNNTELLLNLCETKIYAMLVRIFRRYTKTQISVSVDILRHSYLIYAKENRMLESPVNVELLSTMMAHSMRTQDSYIKDPSKTVTQLNDDSNITQSNFLDINDLQKNK